MFEGHKDSYSLRTGRIPLKKGHRACTCVFVRPAPLQQRGSRSARRVGKHGAVGIRGSGSTGSAAARASAPVASARGPIVCNDRRAWHWWWSFREPPGRVADAVGGAEADCRAAEGGGQQTLLEREIRRSRGCECLLKCPFYSPAPRFSNPLAV